MTDFNNLPAHVWPRNACRQEDGVVTIAGVPLPEIAEDYGTPVFVVDEDDFHVAVLLVDEGLECAGE